MVVVLIVPAMARGQAVIVQQPVVQGFGAHTVVSVPDRGAAQLGGVSSAADFRSWRGFGRPGSYLSSSRSYSDAWATVYVHDLEAMDAALLEAARAANPPAPPPANPLAAQAMRNLLRQQERPVRLNAVANDRPRPANEPDMLTPPAAPQRPIVAETPALRRGAPQVLPHPALNGAPLRVRIYSARSASGGLGESVGPATSSGSPPSDASSRSTNSGDSPAVNRAAR